MKHIKLISANYIKDYKIEVTFNNGLKSVVDLENELWGEIFEPLKDRDKFKKFNLNPFTIEWENGADFSPEFLYELASKENSEIKIN
ncbi:MAG: DUF2442 domain-containing protein [Ignavibacteria bacterium]|nr:DUF2442 domain-containing protein [Ignavibacteria bacterium]